MFSGDREILAMVESSYKEIQLELGKMWEEKEMIHAEDKIRFEVKKRIVEMNS